MLTPSSHRSIGTSCISLMKAHSYHLLELHDNAMLSQPAPARTCPGSSFLLWSWVSSKNQVIQQLWPDCNYHACHLPGVPPSEDYSHRRPFQIYSISGDFPDAPWRLNVNARVSLCGLGFSSLPRRVPPSDISGSSSSSVNAEPCAASGSHGPTRAGWSGSTLWAWIYEDDRQISR